MLPVALSGLVLICNFLKETYFSHLHAYLLACFSEKHLKFLTSHIYLHLNDSKLWKQYLEMMEHICDLEAVKPQEIPIKVCVIYFNRNLLSRLWRKNKFSCNHLLCPNV